MIKMNSKIHFIPIMIKKNEKLIKKIENLILTLVKHKNVEVYYTIQFKEIIEELIKKINSENKQDLKKQANQIVLKKQLHSDIKGHVVGCDFFYINNDSIFFAENIFHTIPYLHSLVFSEVMKEINNRTKKESNSNEKNEINFVNKNGESKNKSIHLIVEISESLETTRISIKKIAIDSDKDIEVEYALKFSPSFYFNYYYKKLTEIKTDRFDNKLDNIRDNGLILKNRKDTRKIDKIEEKEIIIDIDEILNEFKKQIQRHYIFFERAENIGIIVETKKGQSNPYLANQIKNLINYINKKVNQNTMKKNKEVFMFLSNTINQKDMQDFSFIDFWINTACPRVIDNFSIKESENYKKIKIMNANDFIIMLNYFQIIKRY